MWVFCFVVLFVGNSVPDRFLRLLFFLYVSIVVSTGDAECI